MLLLMEMIDTGSDDARKFLVNSLGPNGDNTPEDILRALSRSMRHRFNIGSDARALLDFGNAVLAVTKLIGIYSRAELMLPHSEAFIPSAILCCHQQICKASQSQAMFSIRMLVENLLCVCLILSRCTRQVAHYRMYLPER